MGKSTRIAIGAISSLAIVGAAIFVNPKLATILTDLFSQAVLFALWFVPGASIIFPFVIRVVLYAVFVGAEIAIVMAILEGWGLGN